MKPIKKVVIVGGGTAGWLTAGRIAAEHCVSSDALVEVVIVESPDVKPIGVGEGTWPTMRNTLKKIGVSETEFFRQCSASFKQGAKFAKWVTGKDDDFYYHPLVLPQGFLRQNLVPYWQEVSENVSFSNAVSFQEKLCEQSLAPKDFNTPEYAVVANYAYHLDSAKFSEFLKQHCIEKLSVKHILANVSQINTLENGDIKSVSTDRRGEVEGDLFVDCTGFKSLLLGEHYGVPFCSKKNVLFIDRALAVQAPYEQEDSPIASHTISTAQDAGWIWDIGLPSRKGIGHVYCSDYTTAERAEEQLFNYLEQNVGEKARELSFRQIPINPGHRQKFWVNNCVAVGLSAGFLEPLEASALVLVELSAAMISEQLPANRSTMDLVAKRFNEKFLYRWDRIIDFLKLHYILNQRNDNDFWIDNRREDTIPESLLELMGFWKYHFPWHADFTQTDEVFPSASYQYVLYGMGFKTEMPAHERRSYDRPNAIREMEANALATKKYVKHLPSNRDLINHITANGMPR